MKLINLKKAHPYEFRNYVIKEYDLDHSVINKMQNDNFPNESEYYIFKEEKSENGGLLWRLTLPLIVPYAILMALFVMLRWIITGEKYFNHNKSFIKFHKYWMRKIDIDWM